MLYFLKQEPSIVIANPQFYILYPKQVKGFKKTYSDLPKTDPVDAFVIADCLRFGRIGTKEAYMDDFYASLQKLTRARFHVRRTSPPKRTAMARCEREIEAAIAKDILDQKTNAHELSIICRSRSSSEAYSALLFQSADPVFQLIFRNAAAVARL